MTKSPLILHVFDGFRVGGTEVRTCNIINSLKDTYRQLVISCNGDFSARPLIHDSIDIAKVELEDLSKNKPISIGFMLFFESNWVCLFVCLFVCLSFGTPPVPGEMSIFSCFKPSKG